MKINKVDLGILVVLGLMLINMHDYINNFLITNPTLTFKALLVCVVTWVFIKTLYRIMLYNRKGNYLWILGPYDLNPHRGYMCCGEHQKDNYHVISAPDAKVARQIASTKYQEPWMSYNYWLDKSATVCYKAKNNNILK